MFECAAGIFDGIPKGGMLGCTGRAALVLALALVGPQMAADGGDVTETQTDNPLLGPWTGPFEAPPVRRHRRGAFPPGLRRGAR